jgi:hypothetical protein
MDDIVGIYTGLPEDAWYPDKINVTMGNTEIDGEYKKIDAGGGGVIFLKLSSIHGKMMKKSSIKKKQGRLPPKFFMIV